MDSPREGDIGGAVVAAVAGALERTELGEAGFPIAQDMLRDKGERIGRNPKTGVEVPIAPRRVLTFRASQIMRERIARD